jgi:hypothetical protein
MDGLLPTIMVLTNQGLEDEVLDINIKEYHDILHLFYIPTLTDILLCYMDKEQPLPCPLTPVVHHGLAASPISITSSGNHPLAIVTDLDHPSKGWKKFDAANLRHYPLVFMNEFGQAEAAKYIAYQPIGDETHLMGTHGKGGTVYSLPLHI